MAASLVLLLLLPGCTTPLGDDQVTEDFDCEMEPTTEGCFEPVVTDDDCTPSQVYTGESCRIMLRPEKLDFGTSEATLQIGTEMQQLTPSFLGTHPGMGSKSSLPDGIEIDLESGVISGTPNYEEPSRHYTIIASYAAGIASFRIQITVLHIPVISVQLQSPEMNCTIGESCHMETPSFSGGEPDHWACEPPLPSGLTLGQDGSISGVPDQVGSTNHIITGSNNGGSAYASLNITTSTLLQTPLTMGANHSPSQ